MNTKVNEAGSELNRRIKSESALYYYRATPFTEHGEFNYNGALKEEFFYDKLYSSIGRSAEYFSEIKKILKKRSHKSILLIGNQGCGKTTFIHRLSYECPDMDFKFFDFDKNTSNPTLNEYIEIMSSYLHNLLTNDNEGVNATFYDLFCQNKNLINEKANGQNNINVFFDKFRDVFILHRRAEAKEDFINTINKLFFLQILTLIVLWHLSDWKHKKTKADQARPIVFCLDNLDVLVNKEIIERFFKEYFRFVRNIDSIIQNIKDPYIVENGLYYNTKFTFVFSCRQHTWSRVKRSYRHDNTFLHVSTFSKNITDAFDKRSILTRREEYIYENEHYFGDFKNEISCVREILSDLDSPEEMRHNIYDLFNDDYRQCNITFDEIIHDNPALIQEYFYIKRHSTNRQMYGARGIVYKALFDKFKADGIWDQIGVLNFGSSGSLVSNARMILNYLDYRTYSDKRSSQRQQNFIPFDRLAEDFCGLIDKQDLDKYLVAMFRLGDESSWNELIALDEIEFDELQTCMESEVFITKAGHEYLDLIATHFEFFNTRVTVRRAVDLPLFSRHSLERYHGPGSHAYNFDETIKNVLNLVNICCNNMSQYYQKYMEKRFESIVQYLESPFVYSGANVLHGERIIHTHIRYIDSFRLYVLQNSDLNKKIDKIDVNRRLVNYIGQYIKAGKNHPLILTSKSTEELFPAFLEKIRIIRTSGFNDFITEINV